MNELTLTVTREDYDEILNGRMTEIYQEVTPYNVKQLLQRDDHGKIVRNEYGNSEPIQYKYIRFCTGVGPERESFKILVKGAYSEIFVDEDTEEEITINHDGQEFLCEQVIYELGPTSKIILDSKE